MKGQYHTPEKKKRRLEKFLQYLLYAWTVFCVLGVITYASVLVHHHVTPIEIIGEALRGTNTEVGFGHYFAAVLWTICALGGLWESAKEKPV